MTRQSVILLLIVLLFSCEREVLEKVRKDRVFDVRTVEVKEEEHYIRYRTTGFFEALDKVKVRPEISGRIVEILVEEGQRVSKGEPLLRLEDDIYRSSYEEIRWKLRQTEEELKRAVSVYMRRKRLFEKELISREEFEKAQAEYEALKAKLSSLRASLSRKELDLERTTLRSPIDGVVLRRLVSVGDYVTPRDVVYEVLSTGRLRFVFRVPQDVAVSLHEGYPLLIKAGRKEFRARVSYISSSADSSRLITVKALIKNRENFLKPNMYGEVSFNYKKVSAFKVPEEAVQLSERHSFLWVVRDSRAVKVPVKVLAHSGGHVLVKGGLSDGDRVIVEGLMFLYEGAKVRER